jgi:hypothetical protein
LIFFQFNYFFCVGIARFDIEKKPLKISWSLGLIYQKISKRINFIFPSLIEFSRQSLHHFMEIFDGKTSRFSF